jgi:hypothetical protein
MWGFLNLCQIMGRICDENSLSINYPCQLSLNPWILTQSDAINRLTRLKALLFASGEPLKAHFAVTVCCDIIGRGDDARCVFACCLRDSKST